MGVRDASIEIAQNPKTGALVSTATTGSGLGTLLNLIPNDIGKLATVVGILLSFLLIYANVLRIRRERLELTILRRREDERVREVVERGQAGQPIRRCDDVV